MIEDGRSLEGAAGDSEGRQGTGVTAGEGTSDVS